MKKLQSGQTLVLLLVFMVVAITITTAAVIVTLVNSQSATRLEQGEITLGIAEAGMENAILRLLRNPEYSGETLTVNGGMATIEVSGETTKTITVTGANGNYIRKLQATVDSNSILTVTSWQEIY